MSRGAPAWTVVALSALLPWTAHALYEAQGEDAGVELGGGVRLSAFHQKGTVPLLGHVDEQVGLQRGRLELKAWFGEALEIDVAAQGVVMSAGQIGLMGGGTGGQALRVVDSSADHRGDNYVLTGDVDRLSLAWLHERFELRVGRQAIGHGSARAFSVTDLFAPFAGFSIDTEHKPGVDAVRISVPVGALSEIELYAVGNDNDLADGLLLGRLRRTFGPLDVSLLAGATRGEPTFGLDLQGDVGDAGGYAEALSRPGLDDRALIHTVRATVGVTRRFEWSMTLFGEVHYNGAGEPEAENYLEATQRLEMRAGESFLVGRWYAAMGLDYEWTPLVRPMLVYFQNLTDGSALLAPSLRWDIGQETVFDLGAIVGLGTEPDGLTPKSEFGSTPDVYHASLRVYF